MLTVMNLLIFEDSQNLLREVLAANFLSKSKHFAASQFDSITKTYWVEKITKTLARFVQRISLPIKNIMYYKIV